MLYRLVASLIQKIEPAKMNLDMMIEINNFAGSAPVDPAHQNIHEFSLRHINSVRENRVRSSHWPMSKKAFSIESDDFHDIE